MNKLNVTREGRSDIYLVGKSEMIDFLKRSEQEWIHNFCGAGSIILGADWEKSSVIEIIEKSERLGIIMKGNLGHKLSVIVDDHLECFDIEINEDNLNIIE